MMLPSHLLASLLLGLLLARWLGPRWLGPFDARAWALALGFGVAIDLDHALHFPAYVAATGMAGLHPSAIIHHGGAWQGFMHDPWALALVVPAMLLFRSWLPVVFWGLHMVQDFVVARHFVHFGGPVEWLIVSVLAALVVAVFHLGRDGTPLLEHARRTFGLGAAASRARVVAPVDASGPAR